MTLLYCLGAASILLDTAHVFCPPILALWRGDLRAHHFRFPPLTLGLLALAVCLPFSAAWFIYFWWNIWHFGSQHYGVLCLWRGRQRPWVWWMCMGVTGIAMLSLPIMIGWLLLSLTHWLTDIYLSASRSHTFLMFVVCVLIAGCAGFIWSEPTARGYRLINQDLGHIRIVIGILHFMLSRELWRRGSPIIVS